MKNILLFLFSVLLSSSVLAQNTHAGTVRSIKVMGNAEMEIIPDEIYVSVTLREFTRDKKKFTIEELEAGFVNFVEKETGINRKDIKMESMDASFVAMRRRDKDAVLQNSYEIKYSKASQVNTLFAAMDSLNINRAYVIRYSHSKIDEFKKQIKINAIKAGKEKATYMLEAIGSKCGNPLTINETTGYVMLDNQFGRVPTVSQSNSSYKESSFDRGEETIGGKTIKLRYEVECTFEIL
ncbi:MAG: SIMPL domain-containing protein [Bacteroidia bacterium]